MSAKICYCTENAEQKNLYYDLVKQTKMLIESSLNEDYVETTILICTACKRKWKFTFDDSFHHPIVEWERLKIKL
jgi:DNA-directed RNA polymerase subunit M/transcription elongation factor TFIIS